MLQINLVVVVLVSVFVVLVLTIIDKFERENPCFIQITGESVVIKGCLFDKDFIELVKGLKPFHHELG
ncbi:TGB-3 [Rubus canadensis virus 1]|uniref:Movement protein TGBp3 n=1 Tax=Rubus canadensis virus 1 TaxID=1243178 RepID=K4MT35_9VIRU|nr:TGB-3 [Rubus canadensis virus 1]AFV31420.1 TGB-3 [Rubus canadensis virus 1]